MKILLICLVFNLFWIGFAVLIKRRFKVMNRLIYRSIKSSQFDRQSKILKKIVYVFWGIALLVVNIFIYFYFV